MENDKLGRHSDLDDELHNETDQDLYDQVEKDLMRLAELAEEEANRSDADVLAELDAHVQDLDDLVNSAPRSPKQALKGLTSKAANRPLAKVINIADRRIGGRD
ncbi:MULTISPECIES: hypothetical protein [Mycobacteriaceae]|uniref:hypothetical protein n=1 Tax=Mycobacteriaceae TaxID=1762 RepID=UPI001CD9FECA|nr:hypothetical protein [Mycobacterium sp. WUMAC-067]